MIFSFGVIEFEGISRTVVILNFYFDLWILSFPWFVWDGCALLKVPWLTILRCSEVSWFFNIVRILFANHIWFWRKSWEASFICQWNIVINTRLLEGLRVGLHNTRWWRDWLYTFFVYLTLEVQSFIRNIHVKSCKNFAQNSHWKLYDMYISSIS